MCSVQLAMSSVKCVVCSVHRAACSGQCSLCIVQDAECIVQCAVGNDQRPVFSVHTLECGVCSV